MTRQRLPDTRPGDVITAKKLTSFSRAINKNTRAIPGPKEILQPAEELLGGSEAIVNEVFNAGAANITSTTVTITDSNGDTHDIERIDQVVATEATTGRTFTLNLTYT